MGERRDNGRRGGPTLEGAPAAGESITDTSTARIAGASRDPAPARSDARVAHLARALGNDALKQRFAEGEACRDAWLRHVVERLRTIRTLQEREVALCHRGSAFPWWRSVADPGKREITSPEPTRWHASARLYQQAAERLCQGDLLRGHTLLERAHEAERRAREALTALVDTRDVEPAPRGSVGPLPASTEVTGSCDPPAGLSLARDILAVTTESPAIPHRKRSRDPWWTRDEDQDEEEPGAPGDP